MAGLEIRPFEAAHADDAAVLLAERHRAMRAIEPALDPRWERPEETRPTIEALLAGASGTVAVRDGRLVGYMLGVARDAPTWGANVWIEVAGHATVDPSAVRDMYAVAAARWVDEGRTNHHVIVPATDRDLVDAWFTLDFGQQHVHGIREAPPSGWRLVAQPGVVVRPAERGDLDALAELDLVLPRHQAASPVFSRLALPTLEEARAELEAAFGDARYATWVAEYEGRVVGTAVGCAIEESSMHAGLARPVSAGFLPFAAVLPAGRGRGIGRALGETVLAWARDAGYDWVVADWRSTNLEASRTWTALGFRPLFRRLHRTIG